MEFHNSSSEIYVPDGSAVATALARTTHMAIGAHPDDNEIMAWHGILECFGRAERHFTSVTVTNGAGSARSGSYASHSDAEMQTVRRAEQKKAADVGEYGAQIFLDYSSSEVKDSKSTQVIQDLRQVLNASRPQVIYAHNLADKHDTHVAVALRTIRALHDLPKAARPRLLYGCEVWRDLDWLNDRDKVLFDVSERENLAQALVGVFDSQICGGKRYDLATWGRRRANATYLDSHSVDQATAVIYGVDLTPLMEDEALDPRDYMLGFVERFKEEVAARLGRLS